MGYGKRKKKITSILLASLMMLSLTSCSSDDTSSSYAPSISQNSEEVEIPQESEDSVCYVSSGSANAFYDTVEEGLSHASSGDVVYVIPGTVTTIYEDCSIGEGVTLCLPYQGTTYTNGTDYGDIEDRAFADGFIDSIDYFRKTLLIMNENVTLTVEERGCLIVGGITGTSDTGESGMTSRDYCEILMLADSQITAEGASSIYCYGYIKEATYMEDGSGGWDLYGYENNGSRVEMSPTSYLLAPLAVYDYKGGSVTAKIVSHSNKISPLELFDVPNIQCEILILSDGENTATFQGEYKLYTVTDSKAYTGTIGIVGYEDSLVDLTEGEMNIKYHPRLSGFTQRIFGCSTYEQMEEAGRCDGEYNQSLSHERTIDDNMTQETEGDSTYTTFTVKGKASINKVTVKMGFTILTLNVDSSDFDLPISYRINFVVGDGVSKTDLTVNNAVKIMPGCNIVINKNATVSIKDTLILYPGYENYDYTYWNRHSRLDEKPYYCYPTSFKDPCFVNNGTVKIESSGSFGGTVYTSSEGAVFDAKEGSLTASSIYGNTYDYSVIEAFTSYNDIDTITETAKGYIDGYGERYLKEFEENTSYVSSKVGDDFCWIAEA